MPRDLQSVTAEIEKVERELSTVRSRPTREEVESNLVALLAQLRGRAQARLASPEAIASGSAAADLDNAVALASFVALSGPGAREAIYALCRPAIASALDAKSKAKELTGLQSTIDRLRRELIKAEGAEARRRAEAFEAERLAELNAARPAA